MKNIFKKILVFIVFLVIGAESIFANGWIKDEFGNWLYEENGVFVKNSYKFIDGVEYYFNNDGHWIQNASSKKVSLSSRKNVTFVLEGKDYSDRNYKTEVTIAMPIVKGENAEAINTFIEKEFQNAITKYFLEWRINMLFLLPKIEIKEMLEGKNERGVICFGYFGGGMFNLYLDSNKMEMWAVPNEM